MIINISSCLADATERAALSSIKGQSIPITETEPLQIPSWAIHIPEHSYVGISSPCPSIEEARQQAINSAISQILQAMGADYQLTHESVLSGNLNQSRYEIKERLSYTARWLLNSVQKNIKQYAFQISGNGHVCFVLVRMMPSELEKLKRLTIGAKISARLIGINGAQVSIEVSESNGVGVTITEYRLTAAVRHHHARFITLFLWKVPETDNISHVEALPLRLSLSNSSGCTTIHIFNGKDRLKSIFMGSKNDISITLIGYDELGRSVSASVKIP
ncbi:MAG: hypothetical protein KKD69_06075 [Euryarchaeota archaeon]|nr:hypothetical protein [Euryarchaeota archaeon]